MSPKQDSVIAIEMLHKGTNELQFLTDAEKYKTHHTLVLVLSSDFLTAAFMDIQENECFYVSYHANHD